VLKKDISDIVKRSSEQGWVMEPDAKSILSLAGIDVPKFTWSKDLQSALAFASAIGYPVVAKIVSPEVIHKSDVGGVVPNILDAGRLTEVFNSFGRMKGFAGMLVEEMLEGIELIVGAKIDHQFGPVMLLGIGGTSVEIYRDTSLRMAPLRPQDIDGMIEDLKAHQLLEGYRGSEPVNKEALRRMLLSFSDLAMDLAETIDSIDLNPVFCSATRCTVADARIMLKK
jgi:acetate---CoA ligase (ADP-forming) subunit beta